MCRGLNGIENPILLADLAAEDEKRQVALPLVLEDFKCILNAVSLAV